MKKYDITINGNNYCVEIASVGDDAAEVIVNGERMELGVKSAGSGVPSTPAPAAQRPKAHREPAASRDTVFGARAASSSASSSITSPLPGTIIRLEVREGESIRRGQRIAIIEAMKMENDILSPRDGVISAIYVREGDSVLEGADIAIII